MEKILLTGAAGFIGFHTTKSLLANGHQVIGLDNLNDYYDPELKKARLTQLLTHPQFKFVKMDLADQTGIEELFKTEKLDKVVHLAAQAGVRYSLQNPRAYLASNVDGFLNIIEGCRHYNVGHLVYASTSSVYGTNTNMPFSVHDNVDHPVSLYAATKKSNELIAHTYSHLFKIPTTGLRFFTVYGPWGRPDMALFLFTKAILSGKPIDVFNYGRMRRDFTYVDDIVQGITKVLFRAPQEDPNYNTNHPDPSRSKAPYRLYNIGNNRSVELMDMIEILEKALGKNAEKNLLPIQPGDVPETFADIEDLRRDVGYEPTTNIEVGIQHFVDWYQTYYRG